MRQGNKYGTGAKAKATILHSKIVRALHPMCERCLSKPTTDCAHIISRSFVWTRTEEANAWGLCRGCHMRLTKEPYEHVQFAIETRGEAGYAALRQRALEGVNRKFDWDAELKRLRRRAAEIGVG